MANEPGRRGSPKGPPLIGRDRELAVLMDGLHRGNAMLVCGPAGIGKTALVREAARMDARRIVYVPDARTCARASATIAATLSATVAHRARTASELLRAGRAARARLIRANVHRSAVRAVVLDHIDHPGPGFADLVERWRERAAVVLVARSETTIGRVWQRVWGCPRVDVDALGADGARRLVDATAAALSLQPLDGADVGMLVRMGQGNPGLLVTTLRLAAHAAMPRPPIESLVRRAKLIMLARERDAVVRARRRALGALALVQPRGGE